MNKLFLLICFVGSLANAQVLKSEITAIKTTSPTGLIAGAQTARATIDIKARQLKLDFYDNGKWMTSFETPLNTIHESVCDTMIYQGTTDIDMAQVDIVVSDNRHFGDNCVSYFPVPTTGVTLKVSMNQPFSGTFIYRMDGRELKSE